MSEHGKEVQPIIVVVEENSENVVVQAFSRDSEAVGDEAAFTVNQLDNAISAALPEQLTGVETITTSEGQQLLILSQDANGKLVSMEGTQVEHSAAVLDTAPSCREVSKNNVAEQCAASSESSQMELQQECKTFSGENGNSEVNAILDNVHVPGESEECEYDSESKPHAAGPVGVSKSSKTSSSDMPVTLGQGDSSECWEKPASPSRKPVQVIEENKNGIMDMNVGDNHSSDMTVTSVQSVKPGTEVNLNSSKTPSAPPIVGVKLDTAEVLDADKRTKEDIPCAVLDSKSSESTGNTLEVSECQGEGARIKSMDDVCASQDPSNHFIADATTNPLLGKKSDKSLPVVAEHSEVPSKESLEVGQNTKVCSKKASQSANAEQQNEHLSQIIRCSSACATVTGPLHRSLEPEAGKHSVILRADAAGLAKSRVGHPPQCHTKGNSSLKDVSILKPQACSIFASSDSEASSTALQQKQESLEEKEGTKCTRYCAVEDEKSASHPVSTSVEKGLESRDEHADFNIEYLPTDRQELSQTSRSAVAHNIDEPEEEITSAKLYAHKKTNEPGQISLKGETLKVQPAASILSSNVITDNDKAKSQLIEKDNPLTELCDVLRENSQSTLDPQTKSIQKEEALKLSEVKALHEMPKKQSDKMTMIPVTSNYAESKLQGSSHNESHKGSQKRESESVKEAPSDATLVADQGSQPNITKEQCEIQPQAPSELDTEENKLQQETSDSINILPGKPADNTEMYISKCHDSKNIFEHSARRDDIGVLQELHDNEHQGRDACEKTEIRAKDFNQNIQEQVEEGLTSVTDTNSTNMPEIYTSLEKGEGKSSAKGPPTDKLLAALDLVPRPPDDSTKEQDVTAEEPCRASATSDLGNGETKPESECLDEQGDDTPSKKRWSLRTPTKPRKRVIIPDSDDEDFEAYVSEDVQPVTQKSKSEEAFDELLDVFKKEQVQKAAVETAVVRKRSAKKAGCLIGCLPSKSSSVRSRSSDANSIPFEKESAIKTAKVKDVVKTTARKRQSAHTPCTTSQATAVKQVRKRRLEPVKVVPHKKSIGGGAGSQIPSASDTFAGDIRIRCQKPNSSVDKMTSRYHCSKCGFRSARMQNIVRHHKQDCPFSKQQPAWDSKALKSTNTAFA